MPYPLNAAPVTQTGDVRVHPRNSYSPKPRMVTADHQWNPQELVPVARTSEGVVRYWPNVATTKPGTGGGGGEGPVIPTEGQLWPRGNAGA